MSLSFRDAACAGPESITTAAHFENDWLHIAPREFRGYGFRARRFRAVPE
jgi:hypothetical protein